VLHESEEVRKLSLSILIEMVLPGNQSDSLEDFHSESLSSNGSNSIDCILFLLDIVSPNK
jgi:hypothetical protein